LQLLDQMTTFSNTLDSYSIAEIAIGVVLGGLVLFVLLPLALALLAAVVGGFLEAVGGFLKLAFKYWVASLVVALSVCSAVVSVLVFGASVETVISAGTVLGGSALVGAFVIAAVVGLILMLRHSYKSQHSKFATNHRLVDAAWIFSAISPIAALGVAGVLHDGWNGLMVYPLTFAPIAVLASTHLAAPLLIHAGRFLLRRQKALSHDP
jgi:hypothetical protein